MKKSVYIIPFLFSILFFVACDDDKGGVQPDVSEGIVRDYTGLDGCGYIIEMDNGEKLEPVEMTDTSFHFYDGQHVEVWYTELTDVGSFCMAGKIVRIDSIRALGCDAMTDWSDKLPADGFQLDTAFLEGDCLVVKVHYGGGCRPHDFFLSLLPTMGALNTITLAHEAHNDLCEAWISDRRSFDLIPLQSAGSHSVRFILTLNFERSACQQEFLYEY
jgi:hypothetical protein